MWLLAVMVTKKFTKFSHTDNLDFSVYPFVRYTREDINDKEETLEKKISNKEETKEKEQSALKILLLTA